jgi:hypothetical protein
VYDFGRAAGGKLEIYRVNGNFVNTMTYPVVCLKPGDDFVYWFADERSLTTADKKLTENGVFDNVSIIDAAGKCFLVKGVKILRWATMFWGYSLTKAGRLVRIEFDLEENGVISLDQLKERFNAAALGLEYTHDEFKDGFLEASSIVQVINYFK